LVSFERTAVGVPPSGSIMTGHSLPLAHVGMKLGSKAIRLMMTVPGTVRAGSLTRQLPKAPGDSRMVLKCRVELAMRCQIELIRGMFQISGAKIRFRATQTVIFVDISKTHPSSDNLE
jgi:hypothetical protein